MRRCYTPEAGEAMIAAFARLMNEYPRRWYPFRNRESGEYESISYSWNRPNPEFDRGRAVLIFLVLAITAGLAVGAWIVCSVLASQWWLPFGLALWLGVPAAFALGLARHLIRTEPLPTEDTIRPAGEKAGAR